MSASEHVTQNGFSGIKQYVQKLQELFQQHRQDMESTSLDRPDESYNFQYDYTAFNVAAFSYTWQGVRENYG